MIPFLLLIIIIILLAVFFPFLILIPFSFLKLIVGVFVINWHIPLVMLSILIVVGAVQIWLATKSPLSNSSPHRGRKQKSVQVFNDEIEPASRPKAPNDAETNKVYRYSHFRGESFFQYYYEDKEGNWIFVQPPVPDDGSKLQV